MSITLTLPVEILENIDIVRVQADQIALLRRQLDEANALNTRLGQQLAAAAVENRSLRDQLAHARRPPPPVPKPDPIVIKASTCTSSLRPQLARIPLPEPQIPTKVKPSQSDEGIEPDTEWKQTLKKKIEEELRPMVNDAKEDYETKLKKLPPSDTAVRAKASQEFNATMTSIRGLATEQFQTALERERQERRWAAGMELSPEWTEALRKEQQSLMMKFAAERRQSLNRDSRSSASN